MALKLQKATHFGIDLAEAYAKIECFNGNKNGIDITVNFYANADARETNKRPIANSGYSFAFNENSKKNIIAQGYEYLKTLEEFAGAEDC